MLLLDHSASGLEQERGGHLGVLLQGSDGHPVEVLQFPADKVPTMAPAEHKLFLGIDHRHRSGRHDASVKFYRDLLGMHVAGESENYGTEQEHLNNVFGAHLRITALRAQADRD